MGICQNLSPNNSKIRKDIGLLPFHFHCFTFSRVRAENERFLCFIRQKVLQDGAAAIHREVVSASS